MHWPHNLDADWTFFGDLYTVITFQSTKCLKYSVATCQRGIFVIFFIIQINQAAPIDCYSTKQLQSIREGKILKISSTFRWLTDCADDISGWRFQNASCIGPTQYF